MKYPHTMNALLQAAGIGLFQYRPDTGEADFDQVFEAIAGYSLGADKAHISFRDSLILSEDAAIVAKSARDLESGLAKSYEIAYRILRPAGDVIWVRESAVVGERDDNGRPTLISAMLRDITSERREEDRLHAVAAHRKHVAHLVGLGGWEWDIVNDHLLFNDDYISILGRGPGEADGPLDSLASVVHPADIPALKSGLSEYLSSNRGVFTYKLRALHKQGHYIWLLNIGNIVERDALGNPTRMAGGVLNIDSTMHAEQKLKEAIAEIREQSKRLEAEKSSAVMRLDRSEILRGAIFDANPYINILCDETLNIIDCNSAALEYFGFDNKEAFLKGALGKLYTGIPTYQADGRSSVPIMERIIETVRGGYAAFETELMLNGRVLPFNVIMKRISYHDTYVIVIYMIDLLALKEAKAGLVRRDRLLSAANKAAALLIATGDQELSDIVPHALKLLGESVDADTSFLHRNAKLKGELFFNEVCRWSRDGQKTEPFTSVPYAQAIPEWQSTLAVGESLNALESGFESRFIGEASGVKGLLIVPISLLGEFWGFVGFVSEKAARRYDDTEKSILKSLGMMLASAMQREEMMESLVRAKEEALASTNAKTEFLSRMSHEIRTPMNAIIGMTAIARKSDDESRIKHCLGNIDSSSRQLLNIINDVLDMSKIEANKFEINLHEFDFEQMMRSVFNVIQGKVEEKRQEFKLDIQSVFTRNMISDELRLSQVLINLLNNAVKFTPEGGCITLKVRQTPCDKDASTLLVEVSDSGIGISENQIDKLFQSFEQADGSITRKYGGSGLGLSICKKIITLMGGDIRAQSTPGVGSSFLFEVRVGWGGSCRSDIGPDENTRDLSVLVVDDQADVLDYFKNILKSFSIPCDIAQSGREGMHLALEKKSRGESYDLIFIDWMMPQWSGAVTAKEIKKIFPEVTVVMISGMDWEEIGKAVEPYGITHFLPKPILPSVLFNTVVKLTRNTLVTKRTKVIEAMPDWSGKRLLLVEDIEVNREIIISILEETNVMIEAACDGQQAVDMYRRDPYRYDIIMMDLQMPVLDGLGATRQIRASNTGNAKSIPIVAMTANAFKEDVDTCLAAGMNNHVAKPIEVDALLGTITRYLGRS